MRRDISASQFKARCLGLLDQVARDGDVLAPLDAPWDALR